MLKKLLFGIVVVALVGLSNLAWPLPDGGPETVLKELGAKFDYDLNDVPLSAQLEGDAFGDDEIMLLAKLPKLIRVSLAESRVTQRGIRSFRGMEKLQRLDLSRTRYTRDAVGCLSDLPALQDLRLGGCHWLTDDDLVRFVSLKKLDRLDLSETSVTPAGLKHLTQHDARIQLNLDRCPAVNEESLESLDDLGNIRHLSLNGCLITSRGYQKLCHRFPGTSIAMLPQTMMDLRSLGRYGTFAVSTDGAITGFRIHRESSNAHEPIEEELAVLKTLPRLENLDFSGGEVTDEMMLNLTPLSELRTLVLSHTLVTDRGLQCLSGFPQLTELDLYSMDIEGSGLQHLRSATKLTSLRVQTRQGDEILEHLDGLHGLRHLTIVAPLTDAGITRISTFSELKSLGLVDTSITGPGLKHLANLPSLSRLYFTGQSMDDSVVDVIASWMSLKFVRFNQTRVTESAVARLQGLRPELSVRSEAPVSLDQPVLVQ